MPWTKEINKGLEEANKKYNYSLNYYSINFDYLRIKEHISPKDWEYFIKKNIRI